ncbi:MAG: hypothetical protein ACLR43_02020 [Faecalibacillus faecis]
MATGLVSMGTNNVTDRSGAMKTGWIKQMEHITCKYSGYIQTGWLHNGSWYYLDQDGKMVVGDYYINDRYYYFNSNGDLPIRLVL